MANVEHLKTLKQGIQEWNIWRRVHHKVVPDFSGYDFKEAYLCGANLRSADLRGTNLYNAIMIGADLRNANLSETNLQRAILRHVDLTDSYLNQSNLTNTDLAGARLCRTDLTRASLREANLISVNAKEAKFIDVDFRRADLSGVDFSGADLSGANLSNTILSDGNLKGALLINANLTGSNLRGTNLTQAIIANTVFAGNDLGSVRGLKTVQHQSRSVLDHATLTISAGRIPEPFLRGCGLTDWEIEMTKAYRTDLTRDQLIDLTYRIYESRSNPLIQFHSCFISYSSKDEKFVRRLYTDLQANGVRCWFAPEHMKIGARLRSSIDDSIRLHDKLLLILSAASVTSQWIEQEVATALDKEREQGCEVLFPIRLDNTVLNLRTDWPALIKNTRHIGDFCRWDYPQEYNKALARLLNDLREQV